MLFFVTLNMTAQPNYVLQNKMDLATFDKIKNFVIKKGGKQTFRNFDNNNPHYTSKFFEIYLGSDIGQKNINNEPKKSNFNEMQVFSKKYSGINFCLIAVRKGDQKLNKYWIYPDMIEGYVYVYMTNKYSFEIIENEINSFLRDINTKLKSN